MLYTLPIVSGGAEAQEGGGIARAWMDGAKVHPGTPMSKRWRRIQTVVLLKFVTFIDNAWHALRTDKLGNCDTATWLDKISAKRKHHTKSVKSSYIYMKM